MPAVYGQRLTVGQSGHGMADGKPRQLTAMRQRPRTADGRDNPPGQKIAYRGEGGAGRGLVAHHGVRFLDARPECRRRVLEVLR
jgi:hypothetical protein